MPGILRWEVHRYIIEKMKDTHFIAALGGGLGFPKFGATPEDQFISLVEYPDICAKLAERACMNILMVVHRNRSVRMRSIRSRMQRRAA